MAERVAVPIAQGAEVILAPGGNATVISFTIKGAPGYIGIGVRNNDLSKLVAMLINHAAGIAKAGPSESRASGDPMMMVPISGASLGVAKGTTDQTALLSVDVGGMKLSFAVEVSQLQNLCNDFQNKLPTLPKAQRPH